MLLNYFRVFPKLSSVLSDKSLDNQDDTKTVALNLASTDYLYLAQRYPFTNVFFHIDTANTNASVMSIDIWDGTEWRAAVDVLDGTSSGGKTLAQSGGVQWCVDDDYTWQRVTDTSDTYAPADLQSLHIYNLYWMRIKVSANLSASTDVKEICHAFTTSQKLKDMDIEINGYLESFETGKTDWINEIKTGSKLTIQELQRLGLVMSEGQIIDLNDVYIAATQRTLALIYSNLGSAYAERMAKKMEEFSKSLNIRNFSFDKNADGKLTQDEVGGTIKRMYR